MRAFTANLWEPMQQNVGVEVVGNPLYATMFKFGEVISKRALVHCCFEKCCN